MIGLRCGARTACAVVMTATAALASAAPVKARPGKGVTVALLRTEYQTDPRGLGERKPRLSWQLRSTARGVTQSAYQIRVTRSGGALLWDSGPVHSRESIQRVYDGPPLVSREGYRWQVRVWDGDGTVSPWSEPAGWEMGLLEAADWTARWIEPAGGDDPASPAPPPLVRREFKLRGPVARARAYVTSRGLYEMQLNGRRVGDLLFTPGWTSYGKRLQYQTYDVTPLLAAGDNAVAVTLADGWFRGGLAGQGRRAIYGDRLALLAQIEVTYRDGSREVIGTDASWKASTGPILMSEIYAGESYDARLENPAWARAGFDDSRWTPVTTAGHRKDDLIAPAGPPVRRIQEIKALKVWKTPRGETVVDMGQNMVGWVRLAVEGPAGTTVTLRHAEVLDKDGNFYTENLRGAKATVRYTLKGGGPETFEPHFTFQGFRFVAVDGYPGEVTAATLTGVVVHSAMPVTGELETSAPLVNQLQHNIVWGQKGNFLDVPTDCPQRDERLGWTGDAQVFARTAAFNMDVAGFFTKWLGDVAADQYDNGSVPYVVPDVLTLPDKPAAGSAAWADAAVIIPWTLYLTYDDERILERQYASMSRWVAYEKARAGADDIWDGDFHFGDWLAFATTRPDYPGATTGKDLIATAFYAHSTDLLERAARILGKADDAVRYADQLARIKSAFQREFVTADGRVGENTQTAYAVALEFDLLPEAMRAGAAQRLAREVRERKHLTTGFVGTPYLCHVLSRYGHLEEAYLLLNREDYPSWLYPVKQGATTIWERWDGQKPDGSFQSAQMNSFNHYAYGAIGDWMYRVMAGLEIDEAEPGYRHALVAPRPGGGFTSVRARHETMYGTLASAWTSKDGTFTLAVEVPANARATVSLPGARLGSVTESDHALSAGNGIASSRQDGDSTVVEIGSGAYLFRYPASPPPARLQ